MTRARDIVYIVAPLASFQKSSHVIALLHITPSQPPTGAYVYSVPFACARARAGWPRDMDSRQVREDDTRVLQPQATPLVSNGTRKLLNLQLSLLDFPSGPQGYDTKQQSRHRKRIRKRIRKRNQKPKRNHKPKQNHS